MPGMSAQVPQESVEKHTGLNPLTVTNVSVLFQVESERAAEGAISGKWECWWVENDLRGRQEKNSEDDSIRRWFQLCGWKKLNPRHNIFFWVTSDSTQLFWVRACSFAPECELLSAKHFHQNAGCFRRCAQSHGFSVIASESFTMRSVYSETDAYRTVPLCNAATSHEYSAWSLAT